MTRVLIASDLHANLLAAKEMLKEASYDFGIYLGDMVDYGSKPSETVQLIRDSFDEIIQGNHDYAASKNADCMSSPQNREISEWTRENITRKLMTRSELDYLGNLKMELTIEIDGMRFACYHGAPTNALFGYIYPWNVHEEQWRNEDGRLPVIDYMVLGHTHYQFLSQADGLAVINPGSAGQPRDCSPKPSYLIIDAKDHVLGFKRFNFDRFTLTRELKALIPDRRLLEQDLRLFHLL